MRRGSVLDPPVDPGRDHVLGSTDAPLTLVEYGSYACLPCQTVHEVVEGLRSRFGERMRYVFRHLPLPGSEIATRAAELAELAARTTGDFWAVHEALMDRGPDLADEDLERIARDSGLPPAAARGPHDPAARAHVRADAESARRSGAWVTPTFFINGRRYRGAWDESSLADAMLAPLGHRIQSAAFEFVRWGPSSGVLLGLAVLAALALSNSPLGAAFTEFWETRVGLRWGGASIAHPLLHWINHGILAVFFFVVGLEIKREFTVGHLANLRSGLLPVVAALGGIALPAVIYASIAPPGYVHGWGIPIGTDTAFAVALIVVLGRRVPIELRVFLTAAVIIDDIVAIAVIALFYTGEIHAGYLVAAAVVTLLLVALNRGGVYGPLPYAICGVMLWFLLHESGLHATLAGVILAVLVPTRPPANLKALLAQAAAVIRVEDSHRGEAMRPGPSEPALRILDSIHARIESPADKSLRSVERWSSYAVLPIFALANAGVAWTPGVLEGQGRLVAAIALGLVLGKPLGIVLGTWLAVRSRLAVKPDTCSWRHIWGAGALGGIGFTMSLFIAGVALPDAGDYAAAKIAIFLASLVAGAAGVLILSGRRRGEEAPERERAEPAGAGARRDEEEALDDRGCPSVPEPRR